jgi:hypothetical protein
MQIPESHKFSEEFWQPLGSSVVVTRLEDEILSCNAPCSRRPSRKAVASGPAVPIEDEDGWRRV